MKIVQELLLMSVKNKAVKVNWEEVGTNASYLPLAYMLVMAPGLLALLGVFCLFAALVGFFSFGATFPYGYFLIMGGGLILTGIVLVISYRVILKRQFKQKKSVTENVVPVVAVPPMDQFLEPFRKQLKEEQQIFYLSIAQAKKKVERT